MSVFRHVNQLIALNDVALVEALYTTLLMRQPDPDGMEFYVGQLRSGYEKGSMIVEFASSPEAQSVGLALPGLQQYIAAQKKREKSFWRRINHRQQLESQLNRLENCIGRVLQDTDDLRQEMRLRFGAIEDRLQLTPQDGADPDKTAKGSRDLPSDLTVQSGRASADVDLAGVPLAVRRIFRELSAAIEAIDKSKTM